MNNNIKPTLWAIFCALVMMIWMKWEYANAPKPVVPDAPKVAEKASAPVGAGIPSEASGYTGDVIHIKTDVLDLAVSTKGGTIIESQLLNYGESIDDETPIQLFSSERGKLFHFESGVYATSHENNATHLATFTAGKANYELSGDSLSVPLVWERDGVKVTKTFTFKRGAYDFTVEQRVENNSDKTWTGYQYQRLKRDEVIIKGGLTTFNTFAGGVYSTPEKQYNKISFSELGEKLLDAKAVTGGWVGMMQHYFMGAIIPEANSVNSFESGQIKGTPTYFINVYGANESVPSQSSITFTTRGFVGPKIKNVLAEIAPNLDKATDYGPLFFISEFLFNVLDVVHSLLNNWGWSIILVTLLIKTLLFPLAAKSFKSMAKMRKFQPEMERLRENYGNDRQLLGKKMMELYKKEGINPASGCAPILIQIPIFLAFYYMLMESVELRQAPWIFWIKDLSVNDPYYVLPIINMGLMFLQQRLNPPPTDPIQRKVMTFMPLVFGLLFLVFPAGLVLYWAVSNSYSIVQQYVITKRYGGLSNPILGTRDKDEEA